MRAIWWLFLPCAYFLFCVALMKVLEWAEGYDEILDWESTPEDVQ